VALAILLILACTALGALGDWRARLGGFQALWLVAFALYAVAIAGRARWRAIPWAGAFVMVVALALRMAVLPVTPALSDDVWRYRWDGRVAAAGIDPWRHAPADTALLALRDGEVHPRLNHPQLRTIYPPVAELGFALVARLAPTAAGWKLWVILHDLTLCLLLVAWCAGRGGSAWDAAVYAWNPLVVVEYAGNAHHDPTGIVWLVLALALMERVPERPAASALAAVLAVGVKLVAAPVAAFLWRAWSRPARLLAASLGLGTLAAYLVLAAGPASGLAAFVERWRHNDALFGWLHYALGPTGARIAATLAVLGVVAVAVRERFPPVHATRLTFRAGLLLGPVVHPWYLGWMLALEPLAPSPPWLLLSCTVVLGYGAFVPPAAAGAYHPMAGWRAIEYGLPLLLAIVLAWRGRHTGGKPGVREAARGGPAHDAE
jgi:hypothetical protein